MTRRGSALELAVLGMLADAPMHGYELRKRLSELQGRRLLSFGSLYPCLKALVKAGHVTAETPAGTGRRARIVYQLTASGKEHLADLLGSADATAWNDDTFDIRFALFARTASPTRVRILEGRRSRLEERALNLRTATARGIQRMDDYTSELQRHGLESTEREISWLTDLIDKERLAQQSEREQAAAPTDPPSTSAPSSENES